MEEGHGEKYVLELSEADALERARQSPDEALDIHITYADHDTDNPRNWPKWRKWYITIFVSMLNVITYVYPQPASSVPCDCANRVKKNVVRGRNLIRR